MEIIKDVKIRNYKGLEEVQFPCGSVNILVGPNNTGKSSILELIFMSISSLNHFQDIVETDLSEVCNMEVEELKYFIHKENKNSTVDIELSDKNRLSLEILYSKEGYPQEVADVFSNFIYRVSIEDSSDSNYRVPPRMRLLGGNNELSKDLRILDKLLQKDDFSKNLDSEKEKLFKIISQKQNALIEEYRNDMMKSEKLFLISKLNNNQIAMHVTMDNYDEEIPESGEKKLSYNIPLIISAPKIHSLMSSLYGQMVKKKKLRKVLDRLKNRNNDFEEINEVDDNYFVTLENLNESIPLSFMGDGFRALLRLSFMASLAKNGIILFEEPETSMHPAYMDILAREIIFNSDEAQFFITTHSLELLELILQKAEKVDKLESVKILKLRRFPEGFIEREILSGREAKEEMESIKTDLRGR